MKLTPVGVDIANHLIQVHFINEHTGEVVDNGTEKKASNRGAIVAMANKLARTVWAIAAYDRKYDKDHISIRPY